MRIVCIGGGPAGLMTAVALKHADPETSVTVFERRPVHEAHGWGVTLSEQALGALRQIGPCLADEVEARAVAWTRLRLTIDGADAERDGHGLAIGRPAMVSILAERASQLGVECCWEPAPDLEELRRGADVVAVCDGAYSSGRSAQTSTFGTAVRYGSNKFLWLGTSTEFDCFTFAFVSTRAGLIWLYGYPHDEQGGTCVVECPERTWRELGFADASAATTLAHLQELFADVLAPGELLLRLDDSAAFRWENFPTVTNDRWHDGKVVLVGDAAHTTHYSIGSGTTLALQDALALASAVTVAGPTPAAFEHYEQMRRPAVQTAQRLAGHSAQFFEDIDRYAGLTAPALLTVLRARRHAWLPYLPPRVYAGAYAVTQRVPGLRTAADQLRARLRKM